MLPLFRGRAVSESYFKTKSTLTKTLLGKFLTWIVQKSHMGQILTWIKFSLGQNSHLNKNYMDKMPLGQKSHGLKSLGLKHYRFNWVIQEKQFLATQKHTKFYAFVFMQLKHIGRSILTNSGTVEANLSKSRGQNHSVQSRR